MEEGVNWTERSFVFAFLLKMVTKYVLLSSFNISREYDAQPDVYFIYSFTNAKRYRFESCKLVLTFTGPLS